MARNRVIFALWLLLWLAVWLRGSGSMAGWLALGSAIAAAAEIGVLFPVRRRVTATVSAQLSCRKGEALTVTLRAENTGIFSCAALRAVVRCRDLLTGETETQVVRLAVAGRRAQQAQCVFRPRRCGKLRIETTEVQVLDAFGLAGLRIEAAPAAAALVMPELYPVDIRLSERKSPDADSDTYSMHRPGEDPSETFALREYIPGDRIKSIHWKLSEKTDRLTVRQLGLPVDDSLLLVLDGGAEAPTADAREALGEVFVSLSAALCAQGVAHRAARWAREAGAFVYHSISGMEDLTQALPDLLSAEIGPDGDVPPYPERAETEYARIVVVTLRELPGSAENGVVTVLRAAPEELDREEGLYLAL